MQSGRQIAQLMSSTKCICQTYFITLFWTECVSSACRLHRSKLIGQPPPLSCRFRVRTRRRRRFMSVMTMIMKIMQLLAAAIVAVTLYTDASWNHCTLDTIPAPNKAMKLACLSKTRTPMYVPSVWYMSIIFNQVMGPMLPYVRIVIFKISTTLLMSFVEQKPYHMPRRSHKQQCNVHKTVINIRGSDTQSLHGLID